MHTTTLSMHAHASGCSDKKARGAASLNPTLPIPLPPQMGVLALRQTRSPSNFTQHSLPPLTQLFGCVEHYGYGGIWGGETDWWPCFITLHAPATHLTNQPITHPR